MNKKFGYLNGLRFLSKYLAKHKQNFLLFFLGGAVEIILMVLTPIIFSIMIDQIVYYNDISVFMRVSLVFVGIMVFSCILHFAKYTLHHYLMSMYTFDIKMEIFKKFLNSKAHHLVNYKSGEIINLLIYDSEECMHFIIRNVIHTINGLIRGLLFMIYIYIVDYRAGLLATFFLPVAALITFRQQEKLRGIVECERSFYGTYVSWLFEILKGITEIRLLGAQPKVRKDFTGHQKKIFSVRYKTKLANLASENLIGLVNLFLLMGVFGIAANLSSLGKVSIGNVIVLVTFIMTLNEDTIIYTVRSFLDAQARLVRIDRVRQFLSQDDESDWKGNKTLEVKSGCIEFKNVRFAYNDTINVLDDLNIKIEGGSHLALVGKSGCGKTTIANLLIGFYEIKSGDILIDGQSLYSFSIASIRQRIGIVQQDILIFDATIRENVLLGNPAASEEQIWLACDRAGIATFLRSLEKGLDTVVGKGGLQLSGGQKQRLEISRIYLKDPAIIIFDEATSALDKETEEAIHLAWKELLVGRTAIVISHRESSVLLCDSVIMMESGKARLMGDPQNLMRHDDEFRRLFAFDGGAV